MCHSAILPICQTQHCNRHSVASSISITLRLDGLCVILLQVRTGVGKYLPGAAPAAAAAAANGAAPAAKPKPKAAPAQQAMNFDAW